jgi:hypothetical protein
MLIIVLGSSHCWCATTATVGRLVTLFAAIATVTFKPFLRLKALRFILTVESVFFSLRNFLFLDKTLPMRQNTLLHILQI